MTFDTTYLAAGAAIVSAIVSPFVSWRIAKSTIAANKSSSEMQAELAATLKLSDFRQTWINNLRDAIVELQAAFSAPLSHIKVNADYDGKPDEMMRIIAKIELLLNRHDDYYGGFCEAISKFQQAVNENLKRQYRAELVICCQDVLKKEWDRLRRELRANR